MTVSFISLILSLTSCTSVPSGKCVLTLNIKTDYTVNNGKPFYAIIQQDTPDIFVNSTELSLYNSFTENETNKSTIFIIPNNDSVSKYLLLDKGKDVSVYFLYSQNSSSWKYRIRNFTDNVDYTFTLGKDSIKNVMDSTSWIF